MDVNQAINQVTYGTGPKWQEISDRGHLFGDTFSVSQTQQLNPKLNHINVKGSVNTSYMKTPQKSNPRLI